MATANEISRAEANAARHAEEVPHATAARFIPSRRSLNVTLSNGVEMIIPVDLVQGLAGADKVGLETIEITPRGTGLHWPLLDADVLVEGIIHGAFGSRAWMASQMGRAGGMARTDAKSAASRKNGAKGGRPKKDIAV
ncbi:DUF2442 domain-containing protein [Acetobacter sp.]|uniref:DUF2442 domain-containing protein n=1 Tax=Acetobacter sp. TaxID=440 RepID=UPI0039E885DE